MAKEVKIGLSVIGILLVVFCTVLFFKLRGPAEKAPVPDEALAAAEDQNQDPLKLASGPSTLTVLPPNDKPEPMPRGDSPADDGGPRFSTDRYARRSTATADPKKADGSEQPRPSFLPRTPADEGGAAEDRYAARDRFQRQPPVSDENAPTEPTGRDAVSADAAPSEVAADKPEKIVDPFGPASVKSHPDDSGTTPTGLQPADDVQLAPSPRSSAAADRAGGEINPTAGQGNEQSGQAGNEATANGDDQATPPPASRYDIYGRARRDDTSGREAAQSRAGGSIQRTDEPPDARMPYRSQTPLPEHSSGANATPGVDDYPQRGQLYSRQDEAYTVVPNDSYWTISEKVYGTGGYFKAIQRHNQPKTGRKAGLSVGQTLSVPAADVLAQKYPDLCPKQRQRPAERGQMMSAAAGARDRLSGGGRVYVVEKGDTLFDIARYELGKASRWNEIYDLNRDQLGEDFDYLAPGTKLVLPDGGQPDNVTGRPRQEYPR